MVGRLTPNSTQNVYISRNFAIAVSRSYVTRWVRKRRLVEKDRSGVAENRGWEFYLRLKFTHYQVVELFFGALQVVYGIYFATVDRHAL